MLIDYRTAATDAAIKPDKHVCLHNIDTITLTAHTEVARHIDQQSDFPK